MRGSIFALLCAVGCGGHALTSTDTSSAGAANTSTGSGGANAGSTSTATSGGVSAGSGLAESDAGAIGGCSGDTCVILVGVGGGGSTCDDVSSDPANCGTCGTVCPGGLCVSGTCRAASGGTAIVTGEQPLALALDDTFVYWLNQLPQPDGQIGHTQLKRCPKLGCNGAPAILWDSDARGYFLNVAGGTAWWVSEGAVGAPEILSCATSGCTAPTPLLTRNAYVDGAPSSLAVDGSVAIWSTSTGVYSCPLGGCTQALTSLFSSQGSAGCLTLSGGVAYGALFGATGFVGAGQVNQLFSFTLGGAASASNPEVLGQPVNPAAIVLDDTRLYFVDAGDRQAVGGLKQIGVSSWLNGGIYSCPRAGCGTTPTALASYPSWYAAETLAVDATDVYFSEGDPDSNVSPSLEGVSARLVRCALGGCAGKPTVLATLATGTTPGIALDDTHVYWIDRGASAIFERAK